MYHSFYGLREPPFELTPNPKYLFLTRQHREGLSTLEYGLFSAKGLTVLIGESGTGKTTLIQAALASERCRNVTCVSLTNPALTRTEFVETLSSRFGLSSHAAGSKAALLEELEGVLRERRARGQITALVIDEAQSLSDELLEEIRLLANSETTTQKLLPLVLAGQPELRARLNEPGLRQLKQRVTLRCEITPFSQVETAAYIAHRIGVAGGDAARLFTRQAVMLIHDRARGIPRTVSVMCDNALLTGFALGRQPVDSEVVHEVAHDFDFGAWEASHAKTTGSTEETVTFPRSEVLEPDVPAHSTSDDTATSAPAEDRADDDREMFSTPARPSRFSLFGKR